MPNIVITHYLKEKTSDGKFIVTKVKSENNYSDIGKKRIHLPLYNTLTSRLVNRDDLYTFLSTGCVIITLSYSCNSML